MIPDKTERYMAQVQHLTKLAREGSIVAVAVAIAVTKVDAHIRCTKQPRVTSTSRGAGASFRAHGTPVGPCVVGQTNAII